MDLLSSVKHSVQKYQMLHEGDSVLAAVSGGADSLALLYCLLELRESFFLTLNVCHINHNLRGKESRKDADFVENLCQKLNLPLLSYSADVQSEAKGRSLEEAAREIRYSFLYEAARKCGANKIALGHNQNDNAETLLLRLCRGTGLSGLCGIPPVREGEGALLIRPLIETERAAIEAYLELKAIPFRTDKSNFDTGFRRNRIRHDIIPALQQINPQITLHLAKSAELLREDEKLLSELCCKILEDCLSKKDGRFLLHIPTMLAQPRGMQKRLIREALLRYGSLRNISQAHILQIESLINSQSGKETHLPFDLRVRREYDYLIFLPETEAEIKGFCFDIPIDTPIYIPAIDRNVQASVITSKKMPFSSINFKEMCTKYFNYDKIKGSLQVRSRKPGDRIALAGLGRKKLKDELIDRKIPKAQRDNIPLLAVDNDILWIMDKYNRTSDAYLPKPGCKILALTVYYTAEGYQP